MVPSARWKIDLSKGFLTTTHPHVLFSIVGSNFYLLKIKSQHALWKGSSYYDATSKRKKKHTHFVWCSACYLLHHHPQNAGTNVKNDICSYIVAVSKCMCMCFWMGDRIWASFFNHPHKFLLDFHADTHRKKFSGEKNCIQAALILHSLVDFGIVLFFLSLQHHRHHHRYGIIKEHSLVMRLTLAIGRILAIHVIYSSWMLFQLFICESDEVCMHIAHHHTVCLHVLQQNWYQIKIAPSLSNSN